jgi:hypothetical protein
MIFSVSVSEGRSIIDWLMTNLFDALFAFSDAPTLTSISKIVSTPGADSNEYKLVLNRPSGPYISPSNFRELPQPFTSSFDLLRPFSTFCDLTQPSNSCDFLDFVFLDIPRVSTNLPDLLRAFSIFEFIGFNRLLLRLSSTLRALLRPYPSLLVPILNTSDPH